MNHIGIFMHFPCIFLEKIAVKQLLGGYRVPGLACHEAARLRAHARPLRGCGGIRLEPLRPMGSPLEPLAVNGTCYGADTAENGPFLGWFC